MHENFWFALALTTFAGLSTGIGSAIAFFAKRTSYRFLSVGTGFAAGVMLYISFAEILPEAAEMLGDYEVAHNWYAVGAFFAGVVVMLLVDRLIPAAENPHEVRAMWQMEAVHEGESPEQLLHTSKAKLHRLGLFTAVAIALHNFPEGMVTFLSALEDPAVGLAIAIAIALHNIPEGMSISVPIYFATGSKRKAFGYSFLAGFAEPIGALVGYAILRPFMTEGVMGVAFGMVAGIMVYISLDELLPTSRAYGKGHESLYGLLSGMAVMALSLLLLG